MAIKRLKVKFILPALAEAKSPYWRPIKYSLFPPLGLATLAGYMKDDDECVIVDEHVEELDTDDLPDLVVIQVYITNAYRAYQIADIYRAKGVFVALGGLHVTALPSEAIHHADAVFVGPGEGTFRLFLAQFRKGRTLPLYINEKRSLLDTPKPRRDLIKRALYLVPNSIVVSRGCPHHCDFCYKDNFFRGGKSFYTQQVDHALEEIESLPGRHLYFLDDHLFGDPRFAGELFEGMAGMNRVFQGAATIKSILTGNTIEKAARAGLKSVFLGFETLSSDNHRAANKGHNLGIEYRAAIKRLQGLGIMINGSFVFGMDDDGPDVFRRTVDFALENGITTSTYHILTPYPGTRLFNRMLDQGRVLHTSWPDYDTRHVVFKPNKLTREELQRGYDWSYREFYKWSSILKGAVAHEDLSGKAKHIAYSAGWKKFEPLWNFLIKTRNVALARPALESLLSKGKAGEKLPIDASPVKGVADATI
jgi:radical SAM superfamily enzyme YgiQ (UPF0313 family)